MATAAFRSTTRRSTVTSPSDSTGSSSSNRPIHHRSRSLSRFSGRFPDLDDSDEIVPVRRGRFVNTERGSGFPDIISLDDLANEFFPVLGGGNLEDSNDRGRSARRSSSINSSSSSAGMTVSQRRARSVSRQPTSRSGGGGGGGDRKSLVESNSWGSNKSGVDNDSRRRRSVSRQPTNRGGGGDRGSLVEKNSLECNKSGVDNDSRRRRSVSRQPTNRGGGGDRESLVEKNSWGSNKSGVDNNSRRRRSVSVTRYHQFSDSESDHSINSNRHASSKNSRSANEQRSSVHNPTATNHQRVLRRSLSHRDLSKPHDGYSSQSSALTDDESRDACSNKHENERTIRAVYSQNMTEHPTADGVETGLYEAMRKELRYAVGKQLRYAVGKQLSYAVDEIRTELEQAIVKTKSSDVTDADCLHSQNSDALQAVSLIRKNYTSRLEQSEKRKQDLLAEVVVEEQRGRELSKIVKDLLPDPKSTAVPEKPLRTRKRSNDRNRMSKCLTEEAERYFEDFISNVEDTDISSLDGERSDASSKLGGMVKSRDIMMYFEEMEKFETPTKVTSLPVEMDGVALPWLEWETSTDGSPLLCKNTAEMATTPNDNLRDTVQEMGTAHSQSNCFNSSRGSCSPIGVSPSVISRDMMTSKDREPENHLNKSFAKEPREPWFDMDEYLQLQQNETMLFENWTQRQRISSGGLLLCSRNFLQF